MEEECLNLFSKTTYSYSEEDRVTNALLIVLQHSHRNVLNAFLRTIGISCDLNGPISIGDHIHYDEHNIVDGEIALAGDFVIAIESKIYKGMFEDDDQAKRYLKLLSEMSENEKILLLISPDEVEPKVVNQLSLDDRQAIIIWLSWNQILEILHEVNETTDGKTLDSYLISEFTKYIEYLGLSDRENHDDKKEKLQSQLKVILGNKTAEKVLLHVYHFESSYASQIARDHGIHLYSVQKQLERFAQGGILNKERRGRTVLYSFNHRNPFSKPLQQLIKEVYDSIPLEEKSGLFSPRYKRRSN